MCGVCVGRDRCPGCAWWRCLEGAARGGSIGAGCGAAAGGSGGAVEMGAASCLRSLGECGLGLGSGDRGAGGGAGKFG